MKGNAVYLDYNATAPLRPGIADAMREIMMDPGNASSIHASGRRARSHVEKARAQVAALAGTHPNQIVFTSGATEANNAVLKAFAGKRIIVSAIEHPSVLESAPAAERIPVTTDGIVDIAAFERMLASGETPALISIMLVNNETGAIQPVADLARLAKKKHPGVFFHTDAVQAAGKIPLDFPALHVDYMSLSAHKMGGPQGAGALIVAPGAKPVKLLHGGGQEKSQRAGTENVAAIVGFGLAADTGAGDMAAVKALRDRLESGLQKDSPEIIVFARETPRIPNTSCFSLPGLDAQTLIMALDLEGFAVSSGSACSSGTVKPSHVLKAMDRTGEETAAALRVSLGWNTKESDVDSFLAVWSKLVRRLKGPR